MDFAFSEEQRMLTDSLQRVMAEQWSYDQRRERFAQHKLDRQAWRQLAELGVTGLMVPQDFGGFGESPATMLVVHQTLGRGIVSEPVIPSAVMAVAILGQFVGHEGAGQWLAAHAEGEAVLSVAWQEDGERYSTEPLTTQLRVQGEALVLKGRKRYVWHAAGSDAMIVTARLEGEMVLVVVPTHAEGVTMQDFPTFDLSRCANVVFDDVKLESSALLAKGQAAEAAFAKGFDYGVTALCAHACGAMQYLIEITTNYLKTRKQFGQPLINFQVLQHRLADMLIAQEMALSSTFVAAAALSEKDDALRSKRVSMVKTEVANAARKVGEEAVQLHGGMGVTDELEVGDYFKRLVYVGILLGDNNFHLARAQSLAAV
ncbi:MAG: acyl-CoA dehydrogenase [Burkholderiaceae bacterium]|nr:acyl-CoA dehydrogenase [Burkholderiaceae bacterium]